MEQTDKKDSLDAKCEKAYLGMLQKVLEGAKENWEKPWLRSVVNSSPQGFDGNLYSGSNRFWLSLMDMIAGYSNPVHVTFPRAISEGFGVLKGEHGVPVIKYNAYYLPDDEGKKMGMKYASEESYAEMDDDTKSHYYRVTKTVGFTVFNLEQTDICEKNPELYGKILDHFSKVEGERDNARRVGIRQLDEMIRNDSWICPVRPGAVGEAYWSRSHNHIRVPEKMDFKDDASFYRTLIHEMVHSTSVLPKRELTPHEKKLLTSEDCSSELREKLEKRRDEPLRTYNYSVISDRAREEMVADLGAAMVMTQIGIDATFSPENRAYLQAWHERIGLKSELGEVLSPQAREFGDRLEKGGWRGRLETVIADVVRLPRTDTLDAVIQKHRLPESSYVRGFLAAVRDGVVPAYVAGTRLVPMTEVERLKAGVGPNVLSEIVKDAWRAAKIVMAEGMRMDLQKDIRQGADFSKENNQKREVSKSKTECCKKSSRNSAQTKSSTVQTRRKYGR